MKQNAESEIIYHRGLKPGQDHPNSFEGIATAYGRAIEVDAFLLADGNVAIMHNNDLRLSAEAVESMTLEEVQEYQQKVTQGDISATPLLEELMHLSLDRGTSAVVELNASSPEKAAELGHRVASIVDDVGSIKNSPDKLEFKKYVEDSFTLASFSIEALRAAKQGLKKSEINSSFSLLWPSQPKRTEDMAISATLPEHLESHGISYGNNDNPSRGGSLEWALAGLELAIQEGLSSLSP